MSSLAELQRMLDPGVQDGPIVIDVATPLKQKFPTLEHPAPPVHVEPFGEPIDPARNAGAFELDGETWRRCLLPSSAGLAGPILATGDCLRSVFGALLVGYFDPTVPAEAGDFVLVEASRGAMLELLDTGRQSAEWWAEYSGQPLANTWGKQLQYLCGHGYLVADDGALPLRDNRILGVLRYVERSAA